MFVNVGLALGASVTYAEQRAIRAELAEAMAGNPAYASLSAIDVRAAGLGSALAAGFEPVGALEVGPDVPGPAAGQIRSDTAGLGAGSPGDPAAQGRLTRQTAEGLWLTANGTTRVPSA